MHLSIFEVERCCLKNIGAELIPSLCFREDGMAQRTRAVATFLRVAHFEDQLHAHRIPNLKFQGSGSPRRVDSAAAPPELASRHHSPELLHLSPQRRTR